MFLEEFLVPRPSKSFTPARGHGAKELYSSGSELYCNISGGGVAMTTDSLVLRARIEVWSRGFLTMALEVSV